MSTSDLFSSSSTFSLIDFTVDDPHDQLSKDIQIDATNMDAEVEAVNLEMFLEDVESIKHELKELKQLYKRIKDSHEESNTKKYYYNSKLMKRLITSQMDSDVALALNKSKLIILGLELLHRSNTDNLKLPGCGQGSSSDRTRTFIVEGLREKLKHAMKKFSSLRERIGSGYKDTIESNGMAETSKSSSGDNLHIYKHKEGDQLIVNDIESQVGKVNSFAAGGKYDEQQRKRIISMLTAPVFLYMLLLFIFMYVHIED